MTMCLKEGPWRKFSLRRKNLILLNGCNIMFDIDRAGRLLLMVWFRSQGIDHLSKVAA
jgi:hypothetical protein